MGFFQYAVVEQNDSSMGNWGGQNKTTKRKFRGFMMQELLDIRIMKQKFTQRIKSLQNDFFSTLLRDKKLRNKNFKVLRVRLAY